METKIKEYLNWKASYAHRASVVYKKWLEKFITVCGVKPVGEYDNADIVKYRNWLEAHHSPSSTQFATIIIKNFFSYCKQLNIPCLSPQLIKFPRIVHVKSHRAITEVEYIRLIKSIPENEFKPLRDKIIIRMLWDTGVRISELCDLDVSQINEHSTVATISTKKTGKIRTIMWSEETHQLLLKYLPIRQELENQNGASALFVGFNLGKGWSLRLTSRSIQRHIKSYVNKVGIKEKITPHSFRHGWAHKRRDQNAPLSFIQRGLGHNNPISTFVYQQYNDKEFEKSARAYLSPAV